MDLDKIFSLFVEEKENIPDVDFSSLNNNPTYNIGMFEKLIKNLKYITSKNYIKLLLGVHDKESQDAILKVNNNFIYTKSWVYISKLDLDSEHHINALKLYNKDLLFPALINSIKHFEGIEEYEKCAFLKKVLDIIE